MVQLRNISPILAAGLLNLINRKPTQLMMNGIVVLIMALLFPYLFQIILFCLILIKMIAVGMVLFGVMKLLFLKESNHA